MRFCRKPRHWYLAMGFGLITLPALAWQSGNTSQSSPSTEPKPGTSSKPEQKRSAAQENQFPEATSEEAARPQNAPQPVPPSAPDAAASGGAAQSTGSAAKDNPFPEDVSRKAAEAARGTDTSSPGESSSSSASDAGPDASDPNADIPADTEQNAGGIRRRLRKPNSNDIRSGSLTGEARAKEDVQVGRYYLSDRNYPGAYARFSEAARFDPANLEAIYGLAATAEKMHRKNEALMNYKLYLQVAPDGGNAKAAKKAIKELSR